MSGNEVMEFLMTYGWAILIVLVAIGSLAYFGVFNSDDEGLAPVSAAMKCDVNSTVIYLHKGTESRTRNQVTTIYDLWLNNKYIGNANGSLFDTVNITFSPGDELIYLVSFDGLFYIPQQVITQKIECKYVEHIVPGSLEYIGNPFFYLEDRSEHLDVVTQMDGIIYGEAGDEYHLDLSIFNVFDPLIACNYDYRVIRDIYVLNGQRQSVKGYDDAFALKEQWENSIEIDTFLDQFNTTIECEIFDLAFVVTDSSPEARWQARDGTDIGNENIKFNFTIVQGRENEVKN